MKRWNLAFAGLMVLLVIFQSGCGGAAPTEQPAATQPPVTEPPAATEPAATEPPAATETPATEPPTATQPPGEPFRLVEAVPERLRPEPKVSLISPNISGPSAPVGSTPTLTIAFTFPDGLMAMKAAAFDIPFQREDQLTLVGVVESGQDALVLTPGTYLVAINLADQAPEVAGVLVPTEGNEIGVTFTRAALERNPAREDSPTFPVISPIIASNSVCFAIGFSDPGTGQVAPDLGSVQAWFRYCSQDDLLSVHANFPERYDGLVAAIEASVANLSQNPELPPPVPIDTSMTISEMEGHRNINACNNPQGNPNEIPCGSDITGAPNPEFWKDFNDALAAANGENFAVTIAVVKVERPLKWFQDKPLTVIPGDYWVRMWFDGNGNFLGTSLIGLGTGGQPEIVPSVPVVEAYFLDAEDPNQIVSWISGWHLCNWCLGQNNCP